MQEKQEPTVQLIFVDGRLEFRLVAEFAGDASDMSGDDAGTWLMPLWDRVRTAAMLIREYGLTIGGQPLASAAAMQSVSPPAVLAQPESVSWPDGVTWPARLLDKTMRPEAAAPSPVTAPEVPAAAPVAAAPVAAPSIPVIEVALPKSMHQERTEKGERDREKIRQAMRTRKGGWRRDEIEARAGVTENEANWQLRNLRRSGEVYLYIPAGAPTSLALWFLKESDPEPPSVAAPVADDDSQERLAERRFKQGARTRAIGIVQRNRILTTMSGKPLGHAWSRHELAAATGLTGQSLDHHLPLLERARQVRSVKEAHAWGARGWLLVVQDSHDLPPNPSPEGRAAKEADPGPLEAQAPAAEELPEPVDPLAVGLTQIVPFSRGKVFLMLGGHPNLHSAKAIRETLHLKELRWPDLEKYRGGTSTRASGVIEINKGDVALVLINRFNRHSVQEYQREAKLVGKPCVSLPKGYNPAQIVTAILDQWPPQWRPAVGEAALRNGVGPRAGVMAYTKRGLVLAPESSR